MNIHSFFSKIGAKKLYLAIGGILLVAVVAGAMFLPGTLFRGALLWGAEFRCVAVPATAVKGQTVKWIAQYKGSATDVFKEIQSTGSNTFWWGDVGDNGSILLDKDAMNNIRTGKSSFSVTYPEKYSANKATAHVSWTGPKQYDAFSATCNVTLTDAKTIYNPNLTQTTKIEPKPTEPVVFEPVSKDPGISEREFKDPGIFELSPAPWTLSCEVTPNVALVGQPVTLKAVPQGGKNPYIYLWADNSISPNPNVNGKTTQTVTATFNSAAKYTHIVAEVKDSLGTVVTQPCIINFSESILAPPPIAPPLTALCSASPNPVKVGQEVTWTANVKGGTPPYKTTWADPTDSNVNNKTTSSVNTSYDLPLKKHEITLTVVDAKRISVGNLCSVEVLPASTQTNPLSATCAVNPTAIKAGDTVTWTASPTGGDGKYSYLWFGDKIEGKTTKSAQAKFTQQPLTENYRVIVSSAGTTSTITCPKLTYTATIQQVQPPVEPAVEEKPGVPSKCPGVDYPTDIKGHWAEDYIKRGYDYCLFKGVGGKFFPDRNATRIEAASMILYSKDKQPSATCTALPCMTPFYDLQSSDQGAILNPLYFESLIEGYPNNQFRPQSLITRAEGASLIVKAFFEPYGPSCYDPHCGAGWPDNFFLDITETWQGKYIRVLWDLRIMTGAGPNRVEPNRSITRAEMAKMIVLAYEETN